MLINIFFIYKSLKIIFFNLLFIIFLIITLKELMIFYLNYKYK
jgi:hypothetical protein